MRHLTYTTAILATVTLLGCGPHATPRAAYVRATLPYDAYCLVSAASQLRKENPDSKQIIRLHQAVLEHLLRLEICLNDPQIPDSDKKYARDVFPKVIAYAATNKIAVVFEPGKQYDMLPNDFVLPPHMAIRDVVDEIIRSQK
jgi:hypothetical protein